MRTEGLAGATLAVAQERELARVRERIVRKVAEQGDVALARLWLIDVGDVCEECPMRRECPDHARCLQLAASAGTPRDPAASWDRLDGAFRRFPLGVHKIGRVGANGTGMLLHDMTERSTWIAQPSWAAGEGIRSFAAQPLVLHGEVLGVLGVFSRARIAADAFAWLRAFADHAALAIANARAFEEIERLRARLEIENACLREEGRRARGGEAIVGRSPALAKVLEQVDLVAGTDATVLVAGEPGTGKELVARRIHARSRRSGRAFLTVDCGAAPRERFESELFGHAEAAFGGAVGDRIGRLEAADGGTLFLDEVGDMPLEVQGQLLRFLQERTFERVGEARPRTADVRVIAATSRDLAAEVFAGRFREDLYLRLSVFPIVVPPLRERAADVAPLAEHFIRHACARLRRSPLRLTARDRLRLERHQWPGNVRELAGVVERAVSLARDGEARLELDVPGRAVAVAADDVISAVDWRRRERANLEAALQRAGGRIYGPGGAAEILGVPPTTLASRVKVLGLARPSPAGDGRPGEASRRRRSRGSAAP